METIFQSEHKKVMSSQNEHYIDYMGWHLPKIYALNYTITDSDDWENNKRGINTVFSMLLLCVSCKSFFCVEQLESIKISDQFCG